MSNMFTRWHFILKYWYLLVVIPRINLVIFSYIKLFDVLIIITHYQRVYTGGNMSLVGIKKL